MLRSASSAVIYARQFIVIFLLFVCVNTIKFVDFDHYLFHCAPPTDRSSSKPSDIEKVACFLDVASVQSKASFLSMHELIEH